MQTVMAERSKFVSFALAITLFVFPVTALSVCRIPMPAMQEMAMGDAGMTANMPPVSIQKGLVRGSCCDLSAANSPAVSVPRAPEYGATSMATTSSTSVLKTPPMAFRAEPARGQPRSSGPSPQAILCVFLI
jgi:hypothetical protein